VSPHVLWQNASPDLLASTRAGRLDPGANGGIAYEYHAVEALRGAGVGVEVDEAAVRRPHEGMLAYWRRLRRQAPMAGTGLVVRDPRTLAFGAEVEAPVVAMVHHLDYARLRSTPRHRIYAARLLRRLRRADAVVTVSAFWKAELERVGCRRVHVVHNAFDPAEFEFEPGEVAAFRRAYGLPEDRPLVYVGNAIRVKGVEEVYEALKGEGYALVMTGRHRDTDVPVRWLRLPRRDYLRLLAACDVVVCMSRLLEGWNRVAHEAMLCGTPVVGSGVAGMGELLAGGGQMVLKDAASLPEAVRAALAQREALGRAGRRFAEQFDTASFACAWVALIEGTLAGEGAGAATKHASV